MPTAAALLAQQGSESERKRVEVARMCADVEFDHTYACSSSLDAESTTDHSHQDHRDSRRQQAQPSQQLSTSKSRDDAAMPAEVEVSIGVVVYGSDMNETVLEHLPHLEGKLKEMEEENKSLSLRIADLSHRLWKPPEILVYTSLKETIKKRGVTPVCQLLVFSWLSPSTSRKRQFHFANGGVRQKPERSIHRVARSLGRHFQWKNSSLLFFQAALGLEGRRCVRSHRTCTVYVLKDVCYLGGFFGIGGASFVSLAKHKGH